MGFVKHGRGAILRDEDEQAKKTASSTWTEKDQEDLEAENDQADADEERQ